MRALLALLSLAAAVPAAQEAPPLRVATLGTVLAEIAREVGGPGVQVTNLIPAGVDPHAYSPSPADARAIADSDLVLASGMGLEAYLDRLAGSGGRVLAVGDALPAPLFAGKERGEKDPHWWNSIAEVISAVELVRSELTSLRPAQGDLFLNGALAYEARLRALQAWVLRRVAALPPGRRQLVTSHDAFGYFARDYGFTVHSVNGFSTEGEADARHMARLIDLVRRERIPAIFVESSANPRIVSNLLAETGARLGGTLYADGLGPPGSGAETFEAMYRHNVSTIVDALGAP
jgi:zinc/manganese transport system substrate-binding protein